VNEFTATGVAPTDFGSTGLVNVKSKPSAVSVTWWTSNGTVPVYAIRSRP